MSDFKIHEFDGEMNILVTDEFIARKLTLSGDEALETEEFFVHRRAAREMAEMSINTLHINEARQVAATLVHAYDTDNRPPRDVVAKARTWLCGQEGK